MYLCAVTKRESRVQVHNVIGLTRFEEKYTRKLNYFRQKYKELKFIAEILIPVRSKKKLRPF